MKCVNSTSYASLIQVVSILLLISACGGNDQEKVYLNQTFPSLCEAFEAAAKLALENHLEKDVKDYPALRKKTVETLAKTWNVTPSTFSTEKCADLESLGKKSEAQLYHEALGVFARLLDPHSDYLDPEEWKKEIKDTENEIFGMGVEFKTRLVNNWVPVNDLVVEQVFRDSPAYGKLKAGDRVVEIQRKPIAGSLLSDIFPFLQKFTNVTLKLDGQEEEMTIPRRWFKWSPLMGALDQKKGKSIGYIKIRRFTDGTADRLMRMIQTLEQRGAQAFLIDLRNNPGGLVSEVASIVALLKGPGMVITTTGNPSKKYDQNLNPKGEIRSKIEKPITGKPIVIAINQRSASASELMAGALWTDRAIVTGERSYGKGTGWKPIPLSEKSGLGGALLITMFRYYFEDHFSPQLIGISPHVPAVDQELHQVLDQRSREGKETPLTEEDFGKDYAISADSQAVIRKISSGLAVLKSEIEEKANAGEYANVCEGVDDCQLELALAYAETAAQRPLTSTSSSFTSPSFVSARPIPLQ